MSAAWLTHPSFAIPDAYPMQEERTRPRQRQSIPTRSSLGAPLTHAVRPLNAAGAAALRLHVSHPVSRLDGSARWAENGPRLGPILAAGGGIPDQVPDPVSVFADDPDPVIAEQRMPHDSLLRQVAGGTVGCRHGASRP